MEKLGKTHLRRLVLRGAPATVRAVQTAAYRELEDIMLTRLSELILKIQSITEYVKKRTMNEQHVLLALAMSGYHVSSPEQHKVFRFRNKSRKGKRRELQERTELFILNRATFRRLLQGAMYDYKVRVTKTAAIILQEYYEACFVQLSERASIITIAAGKRTLMLRHVLAALRATDERVPLSRMLPMSQPFGQAIRFSSMTNGAFICLQKLLMRILNDIISYADTLASLSHKETLDVREVEYAIKLVLPSQLAVHGIRFAQKALVTLQSFNAHPAPVLADISQKKRITLSSKAALRLSVSKTRRYLKELSLTHRRTIRAAVYVTAALEYYLTEIVKIASYVIEEKRKKRIDTRSLRDALRGDEEFQRVFGGTIFGYSLL